MESIFVVEVIELTSRRQKQAGKNERQDKKHPQLRGLGRQGRVNRMDEAFIELLY
jgi:hypothetical protein